VTVSDRYSSKSTTLKVAAGAAKAPSWSLASTKGWYDLTVTIHGDDQFEYRYAGHLEDGRASISDPGMGGLI
jgi:phospholipase C